MTGKTTGKAREVSHAEQVCTNMFLHDVKRGPLFSRRLFITHSDTAIGAAEQMNVFTVVTAKSNNKKKKIDGRRQRLSVVFEAVLPNLGSSGELDYTQTRGEILAT